MAIPFPQHADELIKDSGALQVPLAATRSWNPPKSGTSSVDDANGARIYALDVPDSEGDNAMGSTVPA